MSKARIYLIIQALLCLLVSGLLIAQCVGLFVEGTAQRGDDPLSPIFTPRKVIDRFIPVAPVCAVALAFTAAGLALGIRDDRPGKAAGTGPAAGRRCKPIDGRGIPALRIALLAAAAALIALGVFNGGAKDVLTKARFICTECIGLG